MNKDSKCLRLWLPLVHTAVAVALLVSDWTDSSPNKALWERPDTQFAYALNAPACILTMLSTNSVEILFDKAGLLVVPSVINYVRLLIRP